MLDSLVLLAIATFEHHAPRAFFGFGDRRKIDTPEVNRGRVHKGHSVRVNLSFRTDASDDADEGLLVGIQIAEDYFLFGGKLVTRNDTGAVAAEKHGLGHFGKTLALHVASGQRDSEFLGDAGAAAEVLVGHDKPFSREAELKAKINRKLMSRAEKLGGGFHRRKGRCVSVNKVTANTRRRKWRH
jgi:hypothetical protein